MRFFAFLVGPDEMNSPCKKYWRVKQWIKEWIGPIQAVVTIVAIVLGGIWTYTLFVKERRAYPQANIEQKISHISLTENVILLCVDVEVTNTGNSALKIKQALIRVQQILPTVHTTPVKELNEALASIDRKDDNFPWPLLAERTKGSERPMEIEPNERDLFNFEFALDATVEIVRIYCYLRNEAKSSNDKEFGWPSVKYYNFKKGIKDI